MNYLEYRWNKSLNESVTHVKGGNEFTLHGRWPEFITKNLYISSWKDTDINILHLCHFSQFRDINGKLVKLSYSTFRSQKIIISARSRLNFRKTCQDSEEMAWLPSSWDVYGYSQEILWPGLKLERNKIIREFFFSP